MSANELLVYLQKVIEAGRGNRPIIVKMPNGEYDLEIVAAIFLENGVDTYQDTSDCLELTTTISKKYFQP